MVKQVKKASAKKAPAKKASAKKAPAKKAVANASTRKVAAAQPAIRRRNVLHNVYVQGQFGRHSMAGPGVHVSLRWPASIATIIARKGKAKALSAALKKAYGVDAPAPVMSQFGKKLDLHWCGAEQWFAISDDVSEGWLYADLLKQVGDLASISDQSHARLIMQISGRDAENLLAKGTPVDLDISAFPIGASAMTQMAHIGVHVVRTGEAEFVVSVFRGFAVSYWEWLNEMAHEYGLQVV